MELRTVNTFLHVAELHSFSQAARELGEKLGRPSRIVNGKKKGRIELEYYGTDDLNDLLDALHAIKKK